MTYIDPPPLPDTVPPAVAAFVMRALDKDPAKRQSSAGDFGRTALAIAAQLREPSDNRPTDTKVLTVPAVPPEPAPATDDRQRKRVRNGFIATGVVVVLAGFLLLHSCTNGGVDTARVPKLVGDTYADAAHTLHNRGFEVKRLGVHRVNTAAGVVVGQSAKRGTVLRIGTTVTLQVSTGPRTITISAADYLGRPGDEVVNELAALHLKVQTLSLQSSSPAGSVIAITPTGQVQEGATVTVTVAAAFTPPGHVKPPKPPKHRHGH